MYIGHEKIANILKKYESRICKADADHCITGFEPLDLSVKPYTKHMLYLVFSPEELKDAELVPYINLLIFSPDKKDAAEYLDPEIPVNYTLLYTDETDMVIRMLREFFNNALGSALMAGSLLDMLYDGRSIQDMVNSFIKGFDNPIFVFDAGFHLIAANYDMVKDDRVSEMIIRNGGITDEGFKLLNDSRMPYSVIRKREKPVRIYHESLGFEQMVCAIDTKKDIGHIVINAVNRPFNETDEEMLFMLKEGIQQQFIKQEFIRNNAGFPYEFFLKDLLDGKIAARPQAVKRMNYVNTAFSGNIFCLVIETARTPAALNTFRIRSDLEAVHPDTKTLLYNGEIIALFCPGENKSIPYEAEQKIEQLCQKDGLYAGMSNSFHSIFELAAYYKQALRAIELGASETDAPGLYCYGRYYMQHIINIFSLNSDPAVFCSPKLKKLLDYDKANGTDLAYSLYMYLISERNSIAASEAMFIHRNTLLYRLKKIDSVVEIDYENYEERRYIMLSYELIMNHCRKK